MAARLTRVVSSRLPVRPFRRAALVVAVAAVLALPSLAAAYEDQLTGGLEVGYAHLSGDSLEGPGLFGGVDLRLGLTDAWNLWGGLGYSLHPPHADLDAIHAGTAAAGVEWVFDVVQIVPYATVGLEALVTASGGTVDPAIGAQVGLGANYLLSRAVALGIIVRYHAPLSRIAELPVYLTAGLGLSLTLAD
ncbi:MAG: hypothetical protein HYY06_08135 [Deltaproteobacteria bacterium]|nr:hypothetical protein [Deltaproteobacteria bacterium]